MMARNRTEITSATIPVTSPVIAMPLPPAVCICVADTKGAEDDRQGPEDNADVVDEGDPAQDHGHDAADTAGDSEPFPDWATAYGCGW